MGNFQCEEQTEDDASLRMGLKGIKIDTWILPTMIALV